MVLANAATGNLASAASSSSAAASAPSSSLVDLRHTALLTLEHLARGGGGLPRELARHGGLLRQLLGHLLDEEPPVQLTAANTVR